MCGIGAIFDVSGARRAEVPGWLRLMNDLQKHRGPDDDAIWVHPERAVGLAQRRLEIIDHVTGAQPMTDGAGNWLTYNGEIYNYRELRDFLGHSRFRTSSDTEAVLQAYRRMGIDCLEELRGMFAFALWDEERQALVVARDPFGIKPLYYTVIDGVFLCASEAKALVPFLPAIDTDPDALCDYLTFQFPLAGATLFRGISELPPGHFLQVHDGPPVVRRYWEVQYEADFDHTERYFTSRLRELVDDSVRMHLRADVPVGAYVSGGLDSAIVASAAAAEQGAGMLGFTGRFA